MEVDDPSETESTEIGVSQGDRQGLIDHYTTVMLQQVIWRPYSSVPEIMKTLRNAGPIEEKQEIIEIFGGRAILKQTIERMRAVRVAALEGALGDLPVETRPRDGENVGDTVPGSDRFIGCWAPWWRRGEEYIFMDAYLVGEQEETDLARYPHEGEDTETYMLDTDTETEAEEVQSVGSTGEDVLMDL